MNDTFMQVFSLVIECISYSHHLTISCGIYSVLQNAAESFASKKTL